MVFLNLFLLRIINIQTNYNQKIKIPNILLGIFRLKTTLKVFQKSSFQSNPLRNPVIEVIGYKFVEEELKKPTVVGRSLS